MRNWYGHKEQVRKLQQLIARAKDQASRDYYQACLDDIAEDIHRLDQEGR